MLFYNIRIAWKSILRNPVLSVLIIGAIALGIGVSTTFLTMHHVVAQDPIPAKSDVLHYVRMDSWDPNESYPGDQPPTQITYRDMVEIMKSDIPVRQGAAYRSRLYVHPRREVARPYRESVRLCFGDFFEMFDVPFRYGRGWDRAADEKPEQVVVIDHDTNQKLFGGADSVGEVLRLGDLEYTVIGVLARWRPPMKFYDMIGNAFGAPEALYIPFRMGPTARIQSTGNSDGWKPGDQTIEDPVERFLASEQVWLQMWVELPDRESVEAYESFLAAYVTDQKQHGRFQRPMDNRVTTITDLIREWDIVPAQAKAMSLISILFLAACALNLMGLLLGKFLSRAPEVGVRRALGASRIAVFTQHLVECEVVGVVGGLLGIGLSFLGLFLANRAFPFGNIFHLDTTMMSLAILLSLLAGLLAGLYPAWRICSIPPAVHLKLQ